jgi:hypothetical protein
MVANPTAVTQQPSMTTIPLNRQVTSRRQRRFAAILVNAVVFLGGCAAEPAAPTSQLLRVAPVAPPVIATEADGAAAAANSAGRSAARVLARPAAARPRPIEPAAAPFLHAAPLGRAFLTAPAPRALALGTPARFCPGAGLATGAQAPARALAACLADGRQALDPAAPRPETCGCTLVAVDDAVLDLNRARSYAAGVGARLLGAGRSGPLTAREIAPPVDAPPGATAAVFMSASGPVAEAVMTPAGEATLRLADGRAFAGRRARRGWSRGRVVERLLLTDAAGARMIALIGVEPAAFAAQGPALAQWADATP